jgi:hypothetical protein
MLKVKYSPPDVLEIDSSEANESPTTEIYKKVIEYVLKTPDLKTPLSFSLSVVDQEIDADLCCSLNEMSEQTEKGSYTPQIKRRLCSLWGMLEAKTISKVLEDNTDFSVKIPKAVWRGTTTGMDQLYRNKELHKYTRLELIRLSKLYPENLNAKFTGLVQYVEKHSEKFLHYIDLNTIHLNKMDKLALIKYKYIICADGNVASYSFFWGLASGSVVIKQDSPHKQYFEVQEFCPHEIIQDQVHYIKVKRDFSDLMEKINWLKNNENKAREIAENAKEYARKYFNLDTFKGQFYDVLSSIPSAHA